ncbi:hypothetical protein PAXRUDRAFT_314862 [Paxillus rubicundulus Ve08.2h10]|uniref:Uncharacterized protein n=1 Tax=Paxillus rubicundulus Ve08.2h10 TaxID=930991 RepID=A0A0D0C6D3_9AGAM|nr:hypothetical protein PAXRUDRAFT_314862 [Paxillus rubicundulus Ve08.2h10]
MSHEPEVRHTDANHAESPRQSSTLKGCRQRGGRQGTTACCQLHGKLCHSPGVSHDFPFQLVRIRQQHLRGIQYRDDMVVGRSVSRGGSFQETMYQILNPFL